MFKIKFLFLFLFFANFNLFAQDFTSIWNTENIESGSSLINQVTIPTNPAFIYNYTVNWGDGNTDTNVAGDITHTYASQGLHTISISGNFPSIYFNDDGDKIKIIEILDWGNIPWQTMENAFHGCENLNFDAIPAPDLTLVNSLENMFKDCDSFNGILNNWDISTITNLSGTFDGCNIFNRPLDKWSTESVTLMVRTFRNCYAFNEPLDNWNTASVVDMNNLFSGATQFNQNIDNWNTSQVTNMSGTFNIALDFNQPLNNWNVDKVTNMSRMFYRCREFNQPLDTWNVDNVTTMREMFYGFLDMPFNQPLNNWNVSNVTDMAYMFRRCASFNQPLNNWDVSSVTDMSNMFEGADSFNQPIEVWDVSQVTNMRAMFNAESQSMDFNQPLNGWTVSMVTNMSQMFKNTDSFNQPLNNWDVSAVLDMSEMFSGNDAFNQPIEIWDVSNVTNMRSMFQQTTSFNQPLNNWTLTSLTNSSAMFSNTSLFNQPLDNWDMSQVTNMSNMFNNASVFNQNLGIWNISSATNMTNMLSNSGISQENYDNILIAWSSQTVNSNVNLGATNLQYCDALTQRQSLIDNNAWNIIGDDVNCSYVLCTNITSPINGDQNVPANSSIRWEAAPNADGYYVSIRREDDLGNIIQIIADNQDFGNVLLLNFTNEFLPGDNVFVTVVPYNDEGPATGCQETSFKTVESWVNRTDVFKITIDTRNLDTNSTAANQYQIELNDGYPDYLDYDFNIDWGDGQYNNNVTNDITHTYLNPGIYTIAIIGDFPSYRHTSSNRDNLKLISMDQWGDQVWGSMNQAFYFCENMEYNATDVPNLTQVTNMASMFRRCVLFNTDINNWEVGNVTNMSSLFSQCSIFNQPLDSWSVSNVTTMSSMFSSATVFNQPIDGWDVSNVTSMSSMFTQTDDFNQPLNSWITNNVTNMSYMFYYAEAFNQDLGNWNTTAVTDMESMFERALSFNQNIDAWDVSHVTNMEAMFERATSFNQPLNSWDVSAVTTMSQMFSNASVFNQELNNWQVGTVTNMRSMFSSATSFNQNIDNWNVTNVTNMASMFSYATMFNQPLNSWDVNSVVNMSSMFRGAAVFNSPLIDWDVSAVATTSSMFQDATLFNQPINTWDVSSVTIMSNMFEGASAFNNSLSNWNVASVTNMESMFQEATAYNRTMENWDTGEVQNMKEMFKEASSFNQNIDSWNTSFVTTMEAMFEDAIVFNNPIDSWNVASVTTMAKMFKGALEFNQNIDSWNVRGVTTTEYMFNEARAFNQPLNNWRVTSVSDMDYMFEDAIAFNQPLDKWNLGNVSMRSTFENATALNQYLGDWDVSGVTDLRDMLDNTALTRENYDSTLVSWSEQTLIPGITLGANGLLYCDALEERQSMIDTYSWTFNGDILDCPLPECTQLISPLNGATDVPVNTNLSWEPALYARGYRITVITQPGNITLVNNEIINANTSYEFATDFLGDEIVEVTITPFNDEGDATGCAQESFTISSDNTPSIPECTTLTYPLNNSTDIATDTDLSWSPIANADGYNITMGTSPGGSDILNNFDVDNVTNYDLPSDLAEDTTFYITITPYNSEGDAVTCTEENFKTELIPVPPACSTFTEPLNGATNVAIETDLSWTAVPNATGYLLTVGTTGGGIEILNSIDVENVTTYDLLADLPTNRLIFVNITPYNDVGDATGCTEQSFRTGTPETIPVCTTLSSPLNGDTDVAIDTDLTWNAIANATGYRLTVGTTSGGTDILNNEDVANVTTFDLPADLPETSSIFVNITPYNNVGDAVTCSEESFSTETLETIPVCTTLSSPLNVDTEVAIGTDLTWNAIANATGYRLTIGTTSGGTDILNNEDVANVTTFDLPADLTETSTIFVTITPYNAVGDAVTCSEESFITETLETIPVCTTLSSPLNGDTDVAINTDLTWNAIANATGYRLTVGTTSGGTDILNNEDVANVTTFDLPADLPETSTIFVNITPYNTVGDAVTCSEESFSTETLETIPVCTTLSSPLNGDTDVAIGTDLTWNAIANATGYRLTVGTTSGGTDILNNEDVANVTTFDLPADLPETSTIFVTITPYNAVGDAVTCSEESFITETLETIPVCTTLSSPLNGDTDVAIGTDLTWNAIANATGYRLTVGTTSGGTDILNSEDVGDIRTFNLVSDLPADTTIFVTITPYNSFGDAITCTQESFNIKPEPLVESKYGFSPNGDGINDFWEIKGIENSPDNSVDIYNRWGDLVFTISNYNNLSNVFRGEANKLTKSGAGTLPSGTYFFHIKVTGTHNLKKLKGFVVIKR
ncbi:BspA family leucine-rich repeat surface protein [Algibacter sp. R77976]|uniref:BspA family leucine-rich repeat surface protein n=1 Tax=Algibacter sp. R77976 TaxID=3093873 RepID=UPI0037C787E4